MRFGAEEPSDGEDAGKRQEYETVCSGRCCGGDPGMERRLWDCRGDGVAVDSCDSITCEGRIGFEYGRQADLAEIFDEVMK